MQRALQNKLNVKFNNICEIVYSSITFIMNMFS